MKQPYFTRKNLIVISLAIFYSFLLIFVGVCIEGSHSFFAEKNPVALLAQKLQFVKITPQTSGFVFLVLVAIYISVYVIARIFVRRYAVLNAKKLRSLKMNLVYVGIAAACILLPIGFGVLIQRPFTSDNIGMSFRFIGQTLALTTIIYVVLFILISGVLLFVVNMILIDKPFRAFDNMNFPEFDDEEYIQKDVTENFDQQDNVEGIPGQYGQEVAGATSMGVGSGSMETAAINKTDELGGREKVFPTLTSIDEKHEGFAIDSINSTSVNLETLCVGFRNYLAKYEGLYFDIDTIRFYISGLAASHFMILEGLSGTGKSSLPRYFAKYTNSKLLFVPIQATYRDKTNLIGYFNDFSKTYTETDFLATLYSANYNPDMLHIIVLDELNISRVEYYFADFLSVLEYPEEDWKLKIIQLPYDFVPPIKLENGVLKIPNNVYFVGTANKDDSTFTITDKVYDRAITMEFDNRNDAFDSEGDSEPIQLSRSKLIGLFDEAKQQESYLLNKDDIKKFNTLCDYIYEQFDITYGNRILNQITELVPVFVACGGRKEDAIDFLLSRKVISKIEGRYEDYVKDALSQLLRLIDSVYSKTDMPRSRRTISTLMRRL